MAYVDPTSLPPTLLPPNRTIQSFAGTVQPRLISTDKFITKSGDVFSEAVKNLVSMDFRLS